jgi:hypothetical protein
MLLEDSNACPAASSTQFDGAPGLNLASQGEAPPGAEEADLKGIGIKWHETASKATSLRE